MRLTSVAPERAKPVWRFPAKGRRAPGEQVVRRRAPAKEKERYTNVQMYQWTMGQRRKGLGYSDVRALREAKTPVVWENAQHTLHRSARSRFGAFH
jgi:hypothetical protein